MFGRTALGIPPQLSLALGGILGDLTGGLLGNVLGGGDEEAKSRAAKDIERRGGASTVNFQIFATQQNTFSGGIAEPQVQTALDRQVTRIVEEVLQRADLSRVKKKANTA